MFIAVILSAKVVIVSTTAIKRSVKKAEYDILLSVDNCLVAVFDREGTKKKNDLDGLMP